MTGVGAYFYLVWGIWLRHCLNGEQADYTLRWPSVLSLPDIVKNPGCYGQDRLRKQATVNGHVKKAD
jgi:dihydroceramidase